MTIKEVYERIDDLKKDRENFINIQELCLGHMSLASKDICKAFEYDAQLNIPLRSLASKTIGNIDNEIARLKKIIKNTQVKID